MSLPSWYHDKNVTKSCWLNTLEPKLARHGYGMAVLCEHLSARRNEVRAYLKGQLTAGKTEDFNKEIHKLGIL